MQRLLRSYPPLFTALAALSLVSCFGQLVPLARANPTEELRSFLKTYLNGLAGGASDRTVKFSFAEVNLDAKGPNQVIVYLMGGGWCGSGGCTTLILSRYNSSYRVITKVSVTRPPIRILESRSHGWLDIAVWVQGGGVIPGYECQLRFDGKSYPSNPTVPPAIAARAAMPGRIIINRTDEGVDLYQ